MGNIYSVENAQSEQTDCVKYEETDHAEHVVEDDFVTFEKQKRNDETIEAEKPVVAETKQVFGTRTDYPSKASFFGADVGKIIRSDKKDAAPTFFLEAIKLRLRQKIYSFILKNQLPNLNAVKVLANEREMLLFEKTDFCNNLRDINFCCVNSDGVLKEDDEMVIWRRQYLRNIRKFRKHGKKIYYLSQTVIMEEIPSVKVKRMRPCLTIILMGSKSGLVNDGCLLIENTTDIEIDILFRIWFDNVLKNLEPNSVIVMDEACWRSEVFHHPPAKFSAKQDMEQWMCKHNMECEFGLLKCEMFKRINKDKTCAGSRIVDQMAEKTDRTVLKVPTHHTEFSPIDLIWTKVKSDVEEKTITLEKSDAKTYALQSLAQITSVHWSAAVHRVIDEEKTAWKIDEVTENLMESYNSLLVTDDSD